MNDDSTVSHWRTLLLDPAQFSKDVLGVRLHAGQERWVRSAQSSENILVTGNRWGKSVVSAVRILHHLLFRIRPREYDRSAPYRVLTASITQEQARIIFGAALRLARQSALYGSLIKEVTFTPYPRLTLNNGAMLEARSTQNRGAYLLGQDYDLVVFDEVAFETEPEFVVEEVLRMRLADRDGTLDLVSTPNGRNWLYRRTREIETGNVEGYVQYGDTRENPNVSREYIDERLTQFSERLVSQNIMGKFVDGQGALLSGGLIDNALAVAQMESQPTGASERYITGWDLARKRTATVGITIGYDGQVARVRALERFQMWDWERVLARIRNRQQEFPGTLVLDATGLGDVIAEQLKEFDPETVLFTHSTKAELLTNLELFHACQRIGYARWDIPLPDGKAWSLENELRDVRWENNNQFDGVMALALALWPLRRQSSVMIAPRVGRIERK